MLCRYISVCAYDFVFVAVRWEMVEYVTRAFSFWLLDGSSYLDGLGCV
jgi:hypothetical protein